MAGVREPSFTDGRSLLPLLRGPRPAHWRSSFLIEHRRESGTTQAARAIPPKGSTLEPPDPDQAGPDGRPRHREIRDAMLLNRGADIPDYDGVRTRRWVFVEYATGERELYDLRTDPDELQSLHADPRYAPLAHRFSLRLAALRGCRSRACRARPHLGVRARPRHRCASRVVRARVTGSGRSHVERADFIVKRRRVVSDRRAPFARRVPLRRVRPGHGFRLRVKLSTDDGRLLTVDRRARRCP